MPFLQIWVVLLASFEDVFDALTELPPVCSIDLISGATLPNAPSYCLAPHEASEVECQLQQLLNTDHIQPSSSPCASPSFIIPKKESEEWHLVTDYRALNKATVKNRYPLPCIDDLLDHLKGACFFYQNESYNRISSGSHKCNRHMEENFQN
jgi:hypothetical protein